MANQKNVKFAPTKKGLLKLGRYMGLDMPKGDKYYRIRKRYEWRGSKELNWFGSDGELTFLYCLQDAFGIYAICGRRNVDGREYDIKKIRINDAVCRWFEILREVA